MLAKARHPPTPHKKRWGAKEKIQPRFCSLRKKYALLLMRLKPPLFPALFRCFLGGKREKAQTVPTVFRCKNIPFWAFRKRIMERLNSLARKTQKFKRRNFEPKFHIFVEWCGREAGAKNRAGEVLKRPPGGNYSFQYQSALQGLI